MPATLSRRRLLLMDNQRTVIQQLKDEGLLAGYWPRTNLSPNLAQWWKDSSGKDHHLRFGSSTRAAIINGALCQSGTSGNGALAPDSAALSVTGDLDLRWAGMLDDWTPATEQILLSKDNGPPSASYGIAVRPTGEIRFYWSQNGTAYLTADSTAAPTVSDGALLAVRATIDVDNGAAGRTVTHYTKATTIATAAADVASDAGWTQLGSPITTAGVTSIFDSAAPACVGASTNGTVEPLSGKSYAACIKNGIAGTTVASPDFTLQSDGQTKFTDVQGNVWSLPYAKVFSGALVSPGVSGNYASTPDSVATSITGSIDLRGVASLDKWAPTANSQLIWKAATSDGAYLFGVEGTTGKLRYIHFTTGAVSVTYLSTVAPTVADGAILAIRVTHDIATGDVKFYTMATSTATASADAASDAGWTQLGTTVAGSTTARNDSAGVLGVSGDGTQAGVWAGRVYAAVVKSGIAGTTVATFDPSTQANGAVAWWGAQNNPWTVNSTNTGSDTNDPLRLDYAATKYVYLPGVAGNYLSVPDAAAVSITSDIDIRAVVAMDDWTPGATVGLVSKYDGASGGQRSYGLNVQSDGTLRLDWSADGITQNTKASTVALPVSDGLILAVRATLDVDNGAVGNDVKHYYKVTTEATAEADCLSDSGWTQLGATVTTALTTSIFDGTLAVAIGADSVGARLLAGKVYAAVIKNGINGTTALNIDTSVATAAATTFTAVSGQTVTINRSAAGRKSTVVDQTQCLLGTDDYFQHPDHDDFDFTATQSFTATVALAGFGADMGFFWSKMPATPGLGWRMADTGSQGALLRIHDGTVSIASGASPAGVAGAKIVLTGVRDTAADNITAYQAGAAGTPTSDTTTTTLANALVFRLGASTDGAGTFGNFSAFSGLIARRALAATEVGRLSTELAAL